MRGALQSANGTTVAQLRERMNRFDSIIVGGGPAGMALALATAKNGMRVAVVERANPEAQIASGFDGRASAIASSAARMLGVLGLEETFRDEGCPIRAIRVTDGISPRFLHFDSAEADPPGPLGYMLENRALRAALLREVRATDAIAFHAPAAITSVERDAVSARVTLADGAQLEAPLVVAADGRRSFLREQAEIRLAEWRYDGVAFISMVRHAKPHDGIASEIFYAEGPLALLPMLDDPEGHRSAIVWVVRRRHEAGVRALPAEAFAAEIEERAGGFLGRMEMIAPVMAFPLGYQHAVRYAAERLVLIGDAAHGIHPIAGQGLNLGLRDVAALAEVLVQALRTGQDLGAPEVARRYERWRRGDNTVVAAATDLLTRLFGLPGPVVHVRRLGLAMVNRLPPLRRAFMKAARGEAGDLPQLLQGEMP